MKRKSFAIGIALLTATAALAHQGVQNPAVKARMDGMSVIAENMKTIGLMAKGTNEFDAALARSAAAAIAEHAAAAPALFESNETDPKSEARPEIWTNFDDFVLKATELETVANGLSTSINDKSDLRSAMRSLGKTCKACHAIYRD